MITPKFNRLLILSILTVIIVTPFALRNKKESIILDDKLDTLVILTPHNESLRYEYTIGFKRWYKARTNRDINIDWRYQGGGQETARYIESMFSNNFRDYWVHVLKRPWSSECAAIFNNRDVKNANATDTLSGDMINQFIQSDVGCGVDLLFGGGFYEFVTQANKGNIVPCDILREHPEMFSNDTIPEFFAGCRLWDEQGRWFGTSLSAFGIIYNQDALLSDGITHFPVVWSDLAQPEYFRKLAIVDPTKSSSMLKAFSMLIQQQMQIAYNNACTKKHVKSLNRFDELEAVSTGWLEGLKIIQKIAANGRYFTESATKPIIDVSSGNCLAGIAVDFYGFAEIKHLEERSGSKRLKIIFPGGGEEEVDIHDDSKRFRFIFPRGGGAPSPDPIAIFRGAKRPDLAKMFIEFILSIDGQKLLDFRTDTPGGPVRTTMRR
ncbi:MAG: extracellular solute-binding protein, partial [Opitutales bacterium]|nr:extracellular solute-binding protein [Opitutales bacterium]